MDLISTLVCVSCGSFQGLRDLNPFQALGLSEQFEVDPGDLKRRLLKLSRMTHPDFFADASEEEREEAEDASARLNEAYKMLLDDFRRADWLLQHLGGPSEHDERQMPQAFLMEVMEWNETLEEGREATAGSPEHAAMERLAVELEAQRSATIASIGRGLDPLPDPGAASLAGLRKELNAIRYMDRALREIRELRLKSAI